MIAIDQRVCQVLKPLSPRMVTDSLSDFRAGG